MNIWYLLTVVYNGDSALNQYINGISADGLFQTVHEDAPTENYNAHLRVAHRGSYNLDAMNGYVDEFKYFYGALNSIGM